LLKILLLIFVTKVLSPKGTVKHSFRAVAAIAAEFAGSAGSWITGIKCKRLHVASLVCIAHCCSPSARTASSVLKLIADEPSVNVVWCASSVELCFIEVSHSAELRVAESSISVKSTASSVKLGVIELLLPSKLSLDECITIVGAKTALVALV